MARLLRKCRLHGSKIAFWELFGVRRCSPVEQQNVVVRVHHSVDNINNCDRDRRIQQSATRHIDAVVFSSNEGPSHDEVVAAEACIGPYLRTHYARTRPMTQLQDPKYYGESLASTSAFQFFDAPRAAINL